MFTESFNSPMVRWHYSSTRQQALSFLQTIGAKALMMTETHDTAVESVKLDGFNEEANLRKHIVSQERIRSIRRNISESIPLIVQKRARNGEVRPIGLLVRNEGKKATFIEWRSKMNYLKRFEVDEETVINCRLEQQAVSLTPTTHSHHAVIPHPTTHANHHTLSVPHSTTHAHAGSHSTTHSTHATAAHAITPPLPPAVHDGGLVRFKNRRRCLDLEFNKKTELDALLLVLQSYVPTIRVIL